MESFSAEWEQEKAAIRDVEYLLTDDNTELLTLDELKRIRLDLRSLILGREQDARRVIQGAIAPPLLMELMLTTLGSFSYCLSSNGLSRTGLDRAGLALYVRPRPFLLGPHSLIHRSGVQRWDPVSSTPVPRRRNMNPLLRK